jgi:hypothetical protein
MIRKTILFSLISIIYCCTILCFNANSQVPIDNSKFNHHQSYIDPKRLTGVWDRIDSKNNSIEFIDSSSEFMLKIKNGNPYYFSKDSVGNVFSNGCFPQWPPLNCELNFLLNDTLQITYSQPGVDGVSYLYIKGRR